CARSTYYFDYW
nr:immunoglobulin heavy chain junction region [Mus musculus]